MQTRLLIAWSLAVALLSTGCTPIRSPATQPSIAAHRSAATSRPVLPIFVDEGNPGPGIVIGFYGKSHGEVDQLKVRRGENVEIEIAIANNFPEEIFLDTAPTLAAVAGVEGRVDADGDFLDFGSDMPPFDLGLCLICPNYKLLRGQSERLRRQHSFIDDGMILRHLTIPLKRYANLRPISADVTLKFYVRVFLCRSATWRSGSAEKCIHVQFVESETQPASTPATSPTTQP